MPTTLPKHHQVLVMPARQAQGKTWRGPVELNVLCGIAGYSTRSGQPVTKHLGVEITPNSQNGPARAGESDAR